MLVLWTGEVALTLYGRRHGQGATAVVVIDGVEQEYWIWSDPKWVRWADYAFPLSLLAAALLLRIIRPADIGLTPGHRRTTLRWTLLVLVIWLLEQPLRALQSGSVLVRTSLTVELIHKMEDVWPELIRCCVLAVLIEEPMLRSIPARVFYCKRNSAVTILVCFFVWAIYHMFHRQPAGMAPFWMISGGVMAWVYLRTGSLIPSAVYHSWNNLFVILKDVLVLQYPEFVRPFLPQQP